MLLERVDAIPSGWKDVLKTIFTNNARIENDIETKLAHDRAIGFDIYPKEDQIFEAFKRFDPSDLRVVIIGQDCYHTEGMANGLCFSVDNGCKMPPSLRNIFAELAQEYGGSRRSDTDLSDWASQGVLLLNRALTVRQASPNSHKHVWHPFTKAVIEWINVHCEHVVFMLWGNDARMCKEWIDGERHKILEHTHPSPLSRKPFVGNHHFRLCNEYLGTGREVEWI